MRLLATFRLDTAENVLSEAEALALTDEFVINTVSVNIGIMRSLCIYDDWTISPILFVELWEVREVCARRLRRDELRSFLLHRRLPTKE